jgi:hypothetical protein
VIESVVDCILRLKGEFRGLQSQNCVLVHKATQTTVNPVTALHPVLSLHPVSVIEKLTESFDVFYFFLLIEFPCFVFHLQTTFFSGKDKTHFIIG